jgi:hypothetical protein
MASLVGFRYQSAAESHTALCLRLQARAAVRVGLGYRRLTIIFHVGLRVKRVHHKPYVQAKYNFKLKSRDKPKEE